MPRWKSIALSAQKREKEAVEETLSNLESADPELCIKLLLFPSVQNFSGLKRKIQHSSEEWMQGFLEQDGLGVLFTTLERLSNEKARSKSSIIVSMELLHCVGCVKTVMNSRIGLDYVIAKNDYTRMLSGALDSSNVMVKKQVFELLAAICIYSPEGKHRAMDAMEHYKHAKSQRYRFSVAVNELKCAENLPYQTAILSFINAAILSTEDLHERIQIRNEFIGLQLLDTLAALRHTESEDLLIQLEVFDERKLEDEDEISILSDADGIDLSNHRDVFSAVFNKVCNSPQGSRFLGVLQSLLQLNPEDPLADTIWEVAEVMVQKAVVVKSEEEAKKLMRNRENNKKLSGGKMINTKVQTEDLPQIVEEIVEPCLDSGVNSSIPPPPTQGIPPPPTTFGGIPPPPSMEGIPPPPSMGGIPPPPSIGGIPPPPSIGGIPPPPSIGGVPPPPSMGGIPPPPSMGGIPPPPNMGGIPPPPSMGGIPPPPSMGGIPPPPSLEGIPPPPSMGGIPPPPSMGGIPPPPNMGGIPPPPSMGGIPPPPNMGGIPPPPGGIPPPPGGIPPPPGGIPPPPGGIPPPPGGIPPPPGGIPSRATSVRRSLSVPKPTSKLRKFNWQKIPTKTLRRSTNSVWDSLERNIVSCEVEPNYKTIEELFSQKVVAKTPAKEKKKAAPVEVSLVDGRRTLNVNIFLRQFRLTNEQITEALKQGNREILTEEKLHNMLKFLPESHELEMIKSFPGDKATLGNVEKYFLLLSQVPDYQLRIEASITRETFEEEVGDIAPQICNVRQACKEIRSCKKLEDFLALILKTGNYMNFGGHSGGAEGFKITSLLKLSETKANKPRMTLLHYVVMEAEKMQPELLTLPDDLATVEKVRNVSVDQIQNDVNKLSGVINKLQNRVEKSSKDLKKTFRSFLQQSSDRVKSLASELEELDEVREDLAGYLVEDSKRFKLEDALSTFAKFASQVRSAIKENKDRLIVEEKKRKREAQEAERKKNQVARGKKYVPPPPEENIIDNLLKDIKKGFKLKHSDDKQAGVKRAASIKGRGKPPTAPVAPPPLEEGVPDVGKSTPTQDVAAMATIAESVGGGDSPAVKNTGGRKDAEEEKSSDVMEQRAERDLAPESPSQQEDGEEDRKKKEKEGENEELKDQNIHETVHKGASLDEDTSSSVPPPESTQQEDTQIVQLDTDAITTSPVTNPSADDVKVTSTAPQPHPSLISSHKPLEVADDVIPSVTSQYDAVDGARPEVTSKSSDTETGSCVSAPTSGIPLGEVGEETHKKQDDLDINQVEVGIADPVDEIMNDGTTDNNKESIDKNKDKNNGSTDKNYGSVDKNDGSTDVNNGTTDKLVETTDKNGGTVDKVNGTTDENYGSVDKNEESTDKLGEKAEKVNGVADKPSSVEFSPSEGEAPADLSPTLTKILSVFKPKPAATPSDGEVQVNGVAIETAPEPPKDAPDLGDSPVDPQEDVPNVAGHTKRPKVKPALHLTIPTSPAPPSGNTSPRRKSRIPVSPNRTSPKPRGVAPELTPGNEESSPQKSASSPQKSVSSLKQSASSPQKSVSSLKQSATSPQKSVSSFKQSTSSPQKSVSSPQKSLTSPPNLVSISQKSASPQQSVSRATDVPGYMKPTKVTTLKNSRTTAPTKRSPLVSRDAAKRENDVTKGASRVKAPAASDNLSQATNSKKSNKATSAATSSDKSAPPGGGLRRTSFRKSFINLVRGRRRQSSIRKTGQGSNQSGAEHKSGRNNATRTQTVEPQGFSEV